MNTNTENIKATVDVRAIPPRDRHPLIFNTFDNLSSGDALLLINDHDPKPLFYQFQAQSKGEFTWDYLEQGPNLWRVRIGKSENAAPPRACGH